MSPTDPNSAAPDPSAPDPSAPAPFDPDLGPGVVAPSYEEVTGYTTAGEPTLDHVRDKIEKRAATAIGAEELAGMTPEVQEVHDAFAAREKAAKARLEEIRKSMGR